MPINDSDALISAAREGDSHLEYSYSSLSNTQNGFNYSREDTGPIIWLTSGESVALSYRRYPSLNGIALVVVGTLAFCFSLLEIIVLPIAFSVGSHNYDISLSKWNVYGMGMWAGIVSVLTGSLGIRAAISKRVTSMHKFYGMTLFAGLFLLAAVVVFILGFSFKWIYLVDIQLARVLFYMHAVAAIFTILAFLLTLITGIQYAEDMCARGRLALLPNMRTSRRDQISTGFLNPGSDLSDPTWHSHLPE